MRVQVHLYSQSEPCEFQNVRNAYTKDGLYCVWVMPAQVGDPSTVYKFPTEHIFRIKEIGDWNFVSPAAGTISQQKEKR